MKNALITVGSTREYIDPVRYITNESSGQQGMALIKSLIKNNFKVICLHGYLQVKPIISKKISYIFTPNAESMLKAAKKNKNVDLAIFNAAVADYRVENYQKQKGVKCTCTDVKIFRKSQHILVSAYIAHLFVFHNFQDRQWADVFSASLRSGPVLPPCRKARQRVSSSVVLRV